MKSSTKASKPDRNHFWVSGQPGKLVSIKVESDLKTEISQRYIGDVGEENRMRRKFVYVVPQQAKRESTCPLIIVSSPCKSDTIVPLCLRYITLMQLEET